MATAFDWVKYGHLSIPNHLQNCSCTEPPDSWKNDGFFKFVKLRRQLNKMVEKKLSPKAKTIVFKSRKFVFKDQTKRTVEYTTKSGKQKTLKSKQCKRMHQAFSILNYDMTDKFVEKKFTTKEQLLFHVYEMHRNVDAKAKELQNLYNTL